MSDDTIIPGPETVAAYRSALGCFGTGVTVVTAVTDLGPLAMTANSFASVSLTPPLVLWCPAKSSQRHDAFAAADKFIIHVLAEDQFTLAQHFARQGHDFEGQSWSNSPDGQPLLNGCLARFECDRHATHDSGDHTIIVGHVRRSAHREGKGLIFKRGQYGGFLELI